MNLIKILSIFSILAALALTNLLVLQYYHQSEIAPETVQQDKE